MPNPEIDIARNIRAIEWVKAQIIEGVATLFKALIKNSEDAIADALATIIMSCYILARRLGVGFNRVDESMLHTLNAEIESGHELENWYGDLSVLQHYMEEKTTR